MTDFRRALLLAALIFTAGVSALAQSDEEMAERDRLDQAASATGNTIFESEVAPLEDQPFSEERFSLFGLGDSRVSTKSARRSDEVFYVFATQLRVRTSPEVLPDLSNVAGLLSLNDEVRVIGDRYPSGLVEVQIVKSGAKLKPSEKYYVSVEHLSRRPQERRAMTPANRFFMVQNIATERLRVYERRCDDGSCRHQMVLEADMAAGEYKKKDPERMTASGFFHITKWIKFYQDNAKKYPSWYDPALPMPPGPGSGVLDWTSDDVKPKGASVRGAFGWFAAHVGPDPRWQWTHGTLGWGSDGNKYIRATRGFWANLFADPRSHGCSRTDNQTIAYLRSLLPVGSPLIKIYAKEAYADFSRAGYSGEKPVWNYILTKNGVRVDGGEEADRDVVLANRTPQSEWLEEGSYSVNQYPDARRFKGGGGRGARNGKNGNVYELNDEDMQGVFLVDAGLVVDYQVPPKIARAGYKDKLVPDFMVSVSKEFTMP
jgi:hypothetical protein